MPVPVFDVASEGPGAQTADPQTHSHAGAASGIRGVIVLIAHGQTSSDIVDGPVSYGGVAMPPRVATTAWTGSEPGRVYGYFLGSGVLQGTRTVSVGRVNATTVVHVSCVTILAAADLEVIDFGTLEGDVTNPSLTMNVAGRDALSFAQIYGRTNSPPSLVLGAGTTLMTDWDFDDPPVAGSFSSKTSRQTTGGSADFAHGFTVSGGSSFEKAMLAMAVAEVVTGAATPVRSRIVRVSQAIKRASRW